VIFVPFLFFKTLNLQNYKEKSIKIYDKVDVMNFKVRKLVLNKNESHLLYGMTLRVLLRAIKNNDYKEKYYFKNKCKDCTHFSYYLFLYFFTNPKNVANFIKLIFVFYVIYRLVTYFY
jgi:hypothetical protein